MCYTWVLLATLSFGWRGESTKKKVNWFDSEFGHIWMNRNWARRTRERENEISFFFIYNLLPWNIHTTEAITYGKCAMFCCYFVSSRSIDHAKANALSSRNHWVFFFCALCSSKKHSDIQRLPHQYCAAPGPCNVWCVCVFFCVFLSIFVLTTHTCYQQNTQNWIETLVYFLPPILCIHIPYNFSVVLAKSKLLPCGLLVFYSTVFSMTKNQEMTSKEKTIDKSSWMGCTGEESRRDNIYLNSLCLVGMIESQKRSNHYYSIGKLKPSTITC